MKVLTPLLWEMKKAVKTLIIHISARFDKVGLKFYFIIEFQNGTLILPTNEINIRLKLSLSVPCSKAMDLLHNLLNIVLLPLTLTVLFLFTPPFLFLKFLWSLKRSIYFENVADKVILITGASSGIGEVFILIYINSGGGSLFSPSFFIKFIPQLRDIIYRYV